MLYIVQRHEARFRLVETSDIFYMVQEQQLIDPNFYEPLRKIKGNSGNIQGSGRTFFFTCSWKISAVWCKFRRVHGLISSVLASLNPMDTVVMEYPLRPPSNARTALQEIIVVSQGFSEKRSPNGRDELLGFNIKDSSPHLIMP